RGLRRQTRVESVHSPFQGRFLRNTHRPEGAGGFRAHFDETALSVEEHEATGRGPPESGRHEMVPLLLLAPRELHFHAAGREHRQREAMAGERILLPGYVEGTENFPVDRIPYHGRRARPWLDARTEVLCRVNLHRVADGKRGADGVGAADALVPVRAGD